METYETSLDPPLPCYTLRKKDLNNVQYNLMFKTVGSISRLDFTRTRRN